MKTTTRRNFFKSSALSIILLSTIHRLFGQNSSKNENSQTNKSFEEMRPGEIIESIKKSPYAFVPVSPMIEWHSFHLPMGTDGIISESVSRIMAEKVGGVWFRSLSLGLDSWRDAKEKKRWGFQQDEKVFGMDFPDLPLKSEYCDVENLKKIVKNRVEALREIGIQHVFLLNHHGGKGQIPTIKELGEELSDNSMTVHGLKTYQFNDLTKEEGFFGVGGHAGYSETMWLMAFRPDLVDLTKQKAGKLLVRLTGILHSKPEIEEKWNPRNVSVLVAHKIKNRVIDNYTNYIDKLKNR